MGAGHADSAAMFLQRLITIHLPKEITPRSRQMAPSTQPRIRITHKRHLIIIYVYIRIFNLDPDKQIELYHPKKSLVTCGSTTWSFNDIKTLIKQIRGKATEASHF